MEEIVKLEVDPLTSCFTRASLVAFLEKTKHETDLLNIPFSIMIIDLDYFKNANDKFGHIFGDETLMYFSSSIRLGMEYDYIKTMVPKFVFRYGGDEFIMVFPGKNSSEAYVLAERILLNIKRRPFLFRGNRFKMSFSGGISTYPEDSKNIEEIIEMADKAMYRKKEVREQSRNFVK